MKKGILKTLIFYGIGFGIAGIISLTVKNTYMHGPGLHHFIIFLTFIIGVIWTLVSLFLLFNKSTDTLKGIVMANAVIIFSILIFLFIATR